MQLIIYSICTDFGEMIENNSMPQYNYSYYAVIRISCKLLKPQILNVQIKEI